jgi:hypothetical protein
MSKLTWFLILAISICSWTGLEAKDRWELIQDDDFIKHYLDVDSFKIFEDNTSNQILLDAWIKVTYRGTGKDRYRESLRKAGISILGYENFSYAINHVLFDDGKICLLGVYDYNNDGLVLRSFDAPVRYWMDIIPGSTIEVWYDQVIAFATANIKSITKQNV